MNCQTHSTWPEEQHPWLVDRLGEGVTATAAVVVALALALALAIVVAMAAVEGERARDGGREVERSPDGR